MVARFKNIWMGQVVDWAIVIGDTVVECDAGPDGFALSYSADGDGIESVILASRVKFRVHCRTLAQKEFVGGLAATFATTTIRIERDGNLFWAGQLLGEGSRLEYDDFGGFWYEMEASDGLASLKDVDYENTGAVQYTGTERLLGHVKKCLARLAYVVETWGEGEIDFFRTANDWKATQHGSGQDPLYATWINQRVWYDYDARGNVKKTSCYEVIRQVVGSLGCRIWQWEGAWMIEQPTQRAQTTLPAWAYEYNLLSGTPITLQGEEELACDTPTARLLGGYTDFLSPLRKATYIWKARQRRNWAPGYVTTDATAAQVEYGGDTVQHTSGNVTFRIQGKLRVRLENTGGYAGAPDVWARFRLLIRVGNYYVQRSINYTNGAFVLQPLGGWGVNPTPNTYDFGTGIMPAPTVVPNFQTLVNVNFLTPILPSGSGQFGFWVILDGIYQIPSGDTATGITVRWEWYDTNIEAYYDGKPINGSNTIEYKQINTASEFGEALEFESLLGDQGTPNDLGGLFAGTATTPSTVWQAGGIGGTQKLGALWAQQMVRARRAVRARFYGALHGRPFPLYYTLETEGKKWVFIGGTLTAATDTVDGKWMELLVPTDGMVVNVIEKKEDPTFLNGRPFSDDGIEGDTSGGQVKWKRWRGTVDSNGHCILSATTHPLPADADTLLVYVEGVAYDNLQFGRTFVLNLADNRIEFSDDQLNGLSAMVVQLI